MKNSYRFFSNSSCQFFPCHQQPRKDEFNCLFCYCPLYSLGEDCGGLFTIITGGIKCCMYCHLPHLPGHYDVIMQKLGEVAKAPNPQLDKTIKD